MALSASSECGPLHRRPEDLLPSAAYPDLPAARGVAGLVLQVGPAATAGPTHPNGAAPRRGGRRRRDGVQRRAWAARLAAAARRSAGGRLGGVGEDGGRLDAPRTPGRAADSAPCRADPAGD